jgi:hypothetical protein
MEDNMELQQDGAAVAVAFNLKFDTVKKEEGKKILSERNQEPRLSDNIHPPPPPAPPPTSLLLPD